MGLHRWAYSLARSDAMVIVRQRSLPISRNNITLHNNMSVTYGTLTFIEPESWPSDQRPYELLFMPLDTSVPACNYKVVQVPGVPIRDMRPLRHELSLDREGFIVANLKTNLGYDEFFDEEKLKSEYVPAVKAYLTQELGARGAYIHECVVGVLSALRSKHDLTSADTKLWKHWPQWHFCAPDSEYTYW